MLLSLGLGDKWLISGLPALKGATWHSELSGLVPFHGTPPCTLVWPLSWNITFKGQTEPEWMGDCSTFQMSLKKKKKNPLKWRLESSGMKQKWTNCHPYPLLPPHSSQLPLWHSLSAPPFLLPSLCSPPPTHLSSMKFKFECMPWRLNYARSVICGGVSFLNVIV